MMQATVQDLRTHTQDLLHELANGAEIIISDHGKPIAKLVPLEFAADEAEAVTATNALFGIWKDRQDLSDVTGYVRHLRKGRFA